MSIILLTRVVVRTHAVVHSGDWTEMLIGIFLAHVSYIIRSSKYFDYILRNLSDLNFYNQVMLFFPHKLKNAEKLSMLIVEHLSRPVPTVHILMLL